MIIDIVNELKQTDWRNFATWSTRVKRGVITLCACVTWLLSFLFFNLGQYSNLSAAQAKESELEQNLSITIPNSVMLQQEKNQLDQIEKLIVQQNSQLSPFDQLGPVLDHITEASANNRLNLVLLKPDPIITVAPYEAVPIEVEINGDYAGLAQFLNQLAHLSLKLYPHQVKLVPLDSSKANDADSMTSEALHLKMVIDMYYVPPAKPHAKS